MTQSRTSLASAPWGLMVAEVGGTGPNPRILGRGTLGFWGLARD